MTRKAGCGRCAGQAARTLLGDSNVIFELAKREPGREGWCWFRRMVNGRTPSLGQAEAKATSGMGCGPVHHRLANARCPLEKLIPAYAVVLLVDGTDAAQTKRAHTPQSRPSRRLPS